ncbi:MAG: hypothetical protein IBJ03_19385 [Gemmatimonadaceae bacterium]|nr:hypothetical protein [Gemmatimonadaceae bacterium]
MRAALRMIRIVAAIVAATLPLALPQTLQGQGRTTDTTRAATPPATVAQPAGPQATQRNTSAAAQVGKAPLSPRRAFLYSLMLPGFGQSRLDRGSSGALFASVELTALVMLRRVNMDLREARTYLSDSLPGTYTPAGDSVRGANPIGTRYTSGLIRTRRLHVEDWLAVLAFNHLFSGADAFVAAQLFDMPVQLTAAPGPRGPWFVASMKF